MDKPPKKPKPSNKLSAAENKAVEKFLTGVNQENAGKPRRKPHQMSPEEKRRIHTAISSMLSEYMDCFIIFGFDMGGNSTVLINTANNLESRGLSDLVEDFLSSGIWSSGAYRIEDDDEEE